MQGSGMYGRSEPSGSPGHEGVGVGTHKCVISSS